MQTYNQLILYAGKSFFNPTKAGSLKIISTCLCKDFDISAPVYFRSILVLLSIYEKKVKGNKSDSEI